jgi:hypothetical protein
MKNYILPIPLTSVTSASINGTTYTAINDAGLPHPCSIIRIINASTTAVQISWDGTHDHDYVKAGDTITLNFQTNRQPNGQVALAKHGTVFYVKGTAGTGFLALAGYYQEN